MADNNNLFNIFEFLGIPVTDNLEVIQKALDALPASKMAELKRNPKFSKLRSMLFAKTATPEFYEYVRPLLQKQKRRERYQKNKLKEEQRKFLEEYNKREEEAKIRAQEQEEEAKRLEEEARRKALEQEEEAKKKAVEQEKEKKQKEQEAILQRLADKFNQFSTRQMSLAFICSFLFAPFRNRWLIYQLFFILFAIGYYFLTANNVYLIGMFILLCLEATVSLLALTELVVMSIALPLLFFLIGNIVIFIIRFFNKETPYIDITPISDDKEYFPLPLLCFYWSLSPFLTIWASFYQFFLMIRTLSLFRNGKFTVGYWKQGHWEDEQGAWKETQGNWENPTHWVYKTIEFKDETGVLCNYSLMKQESDLSIFSAFYNCAAHHENNEPCLVVYDPINRSVNIPIATVSNPQSDEIIGLRTCVYISKNFYSNFNIYFDTTDGKFIQNNNFLRILLVSIAWVALFIILILNILPYSIILFLVLSIISWIPTFYFTGKMIYSKVYPENQDKK